MKFEWDVRKADQNFRKHGVDFADAVIALEDENALTIEDGGHDEQRFKTLGLGPNINIFSLFMPSEVETSFGLSQPGRPTEVKPNSTMKV